MRGPLVRATASITMASSCVAFMDSSFTRPAAQRDIASMMGQRGPLPTHMTLNFHDNSHALIESQSYDFVDFLVKQGARGDLRHYI